MIYLNAFSHDLCKNNGRNRIGTTWKTLSASASLQFKMTMFPVVTGFLYRWRTQTIIRLKVYCHGPNFLDTGAGNSCVFQRCLKVFENCTESIWAITDSCVHTVNSWLKKQGKRDSERRRCALVFFSSLKNCAGLLLYMWKSALKQFRIAIQSPERKRTRS